MKPKNLDLASELIRYLKWEREVYGEWPISGSPVPTHSDPANSGASRSVTPQPGSSQAAPAHTDRSQPVVSPSDPEPDSSRSTLSPSESDLPDLTDCRTLDELKEFCMSCESLRTDLEGTHLVFGTGQPDADLMIIGEAPGEQEDLQGEPFVGKAGQLLNKILHAIEFQREDVYICNILKHRPPENRNPTAEERKRSLPVLLRQIELVNPKLILCLGKISGTTLLNSSDSLTKMRGKFHPFRGRQLMVTYHPAALLRNPQWKRPTWEDVQILRDKYEELCGR